MNATAGELSANPPFDMDVALRCIAGVDVEWRESYNNSPDIIIQLHEGVEWRDIFAKVGEAPGYLLYREIPSGSRSHYYYATHPCGLAQYFNHSGDPLINEGGFGGAAFGVQLPDGSSKVLKGPWSSRATCVNMAVSEEDAIADVIVRNKGGLLSAAIKVQALDALLKHFHPSFSVVRSSERLSRRKGEEYVTKEKPAWTASLSPTEFVKPGGKSYVGSRERGIDVLYDHTQQG